MNISVEDITQTFESHDYEMTVEVWSNIIAMVSQFQHIPSLAIRPFQVISLFLVNFTLENLPGNQEEKNNHPKKNITEIVCFAVSNRIN